MSDKVKMIPRWYKNLRELSQAARVALVEITLDNVCRHGSMTDKYTVQGKKLVSWIKSEFVLVGIAPNFTYLKVKSTKNDLNATYVHPWAMTTLIYKHKTLPFLIQVNAGMRLDQMLLAEIPMNQELFSQMEVTGMTS
jgi:hypothetical protein